MSSPRTISKADRLRANSLLKKRTGEGSKNISDADRNLVEELLNYVKKNDGGSSKKTRQF